MDHLSVGCRLWTEAPVEARFCDDTAKGAAHRIQRREQHGRRSAAAGRHPGLPGRVRRGRPAHVRPSRTPRTCAATCTKDPRCRSFRSVVFFGAVRRLVREHDLVVLVEGSAYMDTWTSALLWYFLWATRCAPRKASPASRTPWTPGSFDLATNGWSAGTRAVRTWSSLDPRRRPNACAAGVSPRRSSGPPTTRSTSSPDPATRSGPGSGPRSNGRPWASRRSTSIAGRS